MMTFSGVTTFVMDEMHLIARGIAKLVYDLINPATNIKFMGANSIYTFSVTITIKKIGQHIKESRATVPRSFEGAWNDHFGSYGAVDWQDFLGVAVPLIVCPHLEHNGAHAALMDLVNGCNRALAHELNLDDIEQLER